MSYILGDNRSHYDAKNVAGLNELTITLSGRMLELHTDLGMNEHTNWVKYI